MALYAYCIIPFEGKNFSFSYEKKKIYLLPYKDIAAVVTGCDKIEYELNETTIREHEKIVRKVMAKNTVVPIAFGMAFKDEEILQAVLEKSYISLKETLVALYNKIEVGIKVILTESPEKNSSSAKEDIENSLCAKSVEAIKGRLFSDKLLLNTSFLIEKNKLKVFSAEVAKLERKYPQFKFQYSGPWPPYSFVNIKIGVG